MPNDFVRDNIWQFVGVMLALITGSLSAVWALRRRELREVTRLKRVSPIFQGEGSFVHEISIMFRGQAVRSLKLYEVGFVNTGNRSLSRSDFDHPIQIDFGKNAQILSWRISASRPLDLPVCLSEDIQQEATIHSAAIQPLLLNVGDGFAVEFLVDGDAILDTRCRILGVSEIRDSEFGTMVPDITDRLLAFVPGLAGFIILIVMFKLMNYLIAFVLSLTVALSVGWWIFGWSDRSRFRRKTVLPTRNDLSPK